MNNSRIELKSIKELEGMDFFIPDYQRGYRWEKQQTEDLLNDILYFSSDDIKKTSEIYCIQPLVVQRKTEDILERVKVAKNIGDIEKLLKSSWNVVDGQQRLTTIFLILNVLGVKNHYAIDYQTRLKSKEFLETIDEKIKDGKLKDENIDFYHMHLVYTTIKDWMSQIDEEKKEKIKKDLLEKVSFIWYQIPDEETKDSKSEAIETFTRLNIGKIPLTDSELIKALFLNRNNFDCSSGELDKKQREIALEWDKIEYTLQNDEFWLFIHNTGYSKPTRIDFILDMICEADEFQLFKKTTGISGKEKRMAEAHNSMMQKKIGEDEHRTFRYFYEVLKDSNVEMTTEWLDEKWNKVREYYQIFNEWYHDYKIYHYIGYLTTIEDKKNHVKELVEKWKVLSKEEFLKEIKERILDILCSCKGFHNLDDFKYDEEYEGKETSKRECVPILLLHNIETIIQQNDKLVGDKRYALPNFSKFPFHLYKREKWEVEHIRPNAGDKIQSPDEQKAYVLLAQKYIGHKGELNDNIDKYMNGKMSFDEVFGKITDIDQTLGDGEKNKIWNYTLLDASTNKEYGNVIFPIKRAFIANKERGFKIKYKVRGGKIEESERTLEIAFVPPCTRNVFAKFYTDIPEGMLAWTRVDAQAYLDDIKEKLDDYINASRGKKE